MRSPAAVLVAVVVLIGASTSGCSSGDDVTGEPGSEATAPTVAATVDTTSTTTPATTDPAVTQPPIGTTSDTTTTAPIPVDPPARLGADLDAEQFAAQLTQRHDTIVDTNATPAERERAGVEYQLLLRDLADRPDLDEAVLAAADPTAQPALTQTVRARQFLQARTASRPPRPLPDELPAWTVVEPEPVDVLLAHYAEAEALTGIGWYWLAAIHLQETRMGRIQGVSTADAVGPMQFLPTTWDTCCVGDPTVTRDAIIGAATYLMQSGGPDDMAAALYQYNPNDGYVAVVTAHAENLRDEPELYPGYHAFQVFFATSAGTVRLPIGYSQATPIDVDDYLASNPDDAA